MEPRIEAIGITQPAEVLPSSDQGVLDGVLRHLVVAQDEASDAKQATRAARRQRRERIQVTLPGTNYEVALDRRPSGSGGGGHPSRQSGPSNRESVPFSVTVGVNGRMGASMRVWATAVASAWVPLSEGTARTSCVEDSCSPRRLLRGLLTQIDTAGGELAALELHTRPVSRSTRVSRSTSALGSREDPANSRQLLFVSANGGVEPTLGFEPRTCCLRSRSA
jgi:hypothetical protein